MNKTKKILLLLAIQTVLVQAYAPINVFRPYDINWRMSEWSGPGVKEAKYRFGINLEWGDTIKSRNTGSNKKDLLEIQD